MENIRKRIKIRKIKYEKDLIKHIARPAYINYDYYSKRLIVIYEKKEQLTLNKPIYAGCAISELNKLAMYKFYYDFVKKNVKNVYYYLLTQIVYAFKLMKIFTK